MIATSVLTEIQKKHALRLKMEAYFIEFHELDHADQQIVIQATTSINPSMLLDTPTKYGPAVNASLVPDLNRIRIHATARGADTLSKVIANRIASPLIIYTNPCAEIGLPPK